MHLWKALPPGASPWNSLVRVCSPVQGAFFYLIVSLSRVSVGRVGGNPLAWFVQVFIPDFLQETSLDLLPCLAPLL